MVDLFKKWFRALAAGQIARGWLAESAAYDDPDKTTRNIGYVTVVAVCVGFGGWAFLAPLESAALGSGTVQVEGNRKPVQHLEGGIVREILVENGDYVTEGQPLLQLDTTQSRSQKKMVEGRMWTKEASVSRLLAERDGNSEIEFLGSVKTNTGIRATITRDSELTLFAARRADRLGEIAVAKQRIAQLEEQIAGSEAVLATKISIAASLEREISDLNQLLSEGYIDKQRVLQLERSLAQAQGDVSDVKAGIASARVAVEETNLTILQIDKRFISRVVDELTQEQDQLYEFQQRFEVLADVLNRATIRSPASGYVLSLVPKSMGAVLAPGQEVAAIVPDVDQLIINVQMSPMDIDRLSVGQRAEVRFSVFKDAYTITGALTKLSPDSLTDPSTGLDYFEATVELDSDDLYLLGSYQLVPGMPADVLIKTGSRTLMGYLTSPLNRMFEESLIEE